MHVILGIDAAWTPGNPSGVAIIAGTPENWKCLCAAPSYNSFLHNWEGTQIDWNAETFAGSLSDVDALISATRKIAGSPPTLITIDMPLANGRITGRRTADQAISEKFGVKGCSTHSPSENRPGSLGMNFTNDLVKAGYPIITNSCLVGRTPGTIEVYPHPALLSLLDRNYRVPYKVSRSARYWPGTTVPERIAKLLKEFTEINEALCKCFNGTHIRLPSAKDIETLSALKCYEDALDAVVCAWIGAKYIEGAVSAYGDDLATIWVPTHRIA